MTTNWRDQAWEEFKLLQGIIDRQMSTRWKIRAWLLGFQAALTVGLFSEKTNNDAYIWTAIAGALIAWSLEMSENFVIAQAIKRQTEIESALKSSQAEDIPDGFVRFGVCATLEVTARGLPTIWYTFCCLKKIRRLMVLLLFVALPVAVRFLLV